MLFIYSASSAFAGTTCGIYFETKYRAVGKTSYLANPPTSNDGGYFVLADWTGDGRSDLYNFRLNQTTQKQDVVIFPALATGYWDWDNPIILPAPFTSATNGQNGHNIHRILDFNADGKADYMSLGSTRTTLYLNDGTSLQTGVVTTWPADSDTFLATVGFNDVTGDGIIDHIYRLRESATQVETLYYAPGNSDGSFGAPVLILVATTENQFNRSDRRVGDFNGDGKNDIAYIAGEPGTTFIRVLTNMGGGVFSLGSRSSFASFNGGGTVADLNGDGRTDFTAQRIGSTVIFYGQANSTFVEVVLHPTNPAGDYARLAGDLNGDGRSDLIIGTDIDYEVFLRNVDGTYTSQGLNPWLTTGIQRLYMKFEDFNADGKADVFDEHNSTKTHNLFGEEVLTTRTNVCARVVPPRFANFNGDMVSDIVTWNGGTGQWSWGAANFNSGSFTQLFTFNWGAASLGDVPAPGDFDGDGKTDHTVYRNGEGKWYTILSSNGSWAVFHFGAPGDIPVPNDYNGGGRTDYAVFRPSDGHWYIWFTETNQFIAHHWGMNGDRPVPADYDGDGRTDIAVFRPSDGVWYYVPSHDWSYAALAWGISTDVPLPADYDGDGKADVAVFRSGIWYILRSYDGGVGVLNWGAATDIPIPVGQAGDIAFPTVYRPSDTKWYRFNLGPGFALPNGGTPVYYGLPNS
jgi:hypothetical protein